MERSPRLLVHQAAAALIELGTRRGAAAVVSYLVELEAKIQTGSLENVYGIERPPNTGAGLFLAMVLPADEDTWSTIAERLDEAIQTARPTSTPARELGNGPRWKAWLEANPDYFTTSLETR